MGAAGFRAAALALMCAGCTSIAVDQRSFEGTRWRVTAINGQPTSARGVFFFEFERGSYSARMGCNQARGRYRVEGDALVAFGTMTTEMACDAVPAEPIPLMTFEEWGFRVLRAPMRMQWKGETGLTLSNANGSIVLER